MSLRETRTVRTNERLPDPEPPAQHERFRAYCPMELLQAYPQLKEGEVVQIPGLIIQATDFPGWTDIGKSPLAGEGLEALNRVKTTIAELARSKGIFLVKGAGDEFLFAGKVNLLESVIFALEIQIAFRDAIGEHQNIKRFLQDKGQVAPYIHVGIHQPDINKPLTLKLVDLGGDCTDLLVMGPMDAKGLAKGYISAGFDQEHTEAIAASANFILSPRLKKLFSQAGLEIAPHNGEGTKHYSITPTGKDDITFTRDQLQLFLNEHPEFQTPKVPFSSISPPDSKTWEIAKNMSPPWIRSGSTSFHPDFADSERNYAFGESAFYFIHGLEEIKVKLDQQTQKIGLPPELTMDLTAEAAGSVASSISKLLSRSGWNMKESETDHRLILKLIALNNVYSRNPSCPGAITPEVFSTLTKSITLLSDPNFKAEILHHLQFKLANSPHYSKIDASFLTDIINSSVFTTQIGLASTSADHLNWAQKEDPNQTTYTGTATVGRSLVSASARFGGFAAFDGYKSRLLELKNKGDLTQNEQQELDQIQQFAQLARGDCVVVQEQVARNLGLLDSKSDFESALAKNVVLKGFSTEKSTNEKERKFFNLVAIRPS